LFFLIDLSRIVESNDYKKICKAQKTAEENFQSEETRKSAAGTAIPPLTVRI